MEHEVLKSDNNQTLWVNSISGECIARFDKRFGIDIHNTLEKQEITGVQCLFCIHRKMTLEDWKTFISEMYKNYNIIIPESLLNFNNSLPPKQDS